MSKAHTMNKLIYLLAATLLLSSCGDEPQAPIVADESTNRTAPAGDVIGSLSEHGAHVWRGLPFAQPPVDELRWKSPRAMDKWQGVRNALEHAPACAQPVSKLSGGEEGGTVSGQEDCLYLDVYAPPMSVEDSQNSNLPVMFWIHGGGNSIGTASSYDASILAKQENVIVVATQYRLGPFGWFYQPDLWSGGDSDADKSGNYGTLDLIQALRWTKANIQAFGGNQNNITIFGESAGGHNVLSLLVSPQAAGLFERAISQSGAVSFVNIQQASTVRDNSSYGASERMLALAGKKSADELRSLNTEQVLAAYPSGPGSGMIPMPTILHDGHVLPLKTALNSFAAGEYNQVPIILGSNKDEQKLFQFLDPKYSDTWFGIWTRAKDKKVYARDAAYHTDHWRLIGVEEPARRISKSPVYAYRFDWDDLGSPLGMDFSFLFGAAHAFDIPFIFGGIGLGPLGQILDSTPNPEQRTELSKAMMNYWANFARSGNPNGEDLPEWKAWEPNGQEQTMVFDANNDGGVRMSNDVLTVDGLFNTLKSDADFESDEERCDMLVKFKSRSPLFEGYSLELGCE